MHIGMSHERDSTWERHQSIYRVYFFEEPGPGHTVTTFDIADATFSEANTWAEIQAGNRMYTIALLSSNEQGKNGLVWLIGDDANDWLDPDAAEERHGVQKRLRQEMVANRSRRK